MIRAITDSLTAYDNYKGDSILVIISLIAILYIWIIEDKKELKLVLAYIPAAIMGIFFFPLFSFVVSRYFLSGGVYYRILWLLPFTVISAYAFVRVISHLETLKKRVIAGWIFAAVIIQSGSFIYMNPEMTRAENHYHVPDKVIAVADILHVEGRDVKAVVPNELLQSIRQYDASIHLAYGREELVDGWSSNPLYEIMERIPVKTYPLVDTARTQGIEYIVLRTGTPTVGTKSIDRMEYTLIAQESGYDIYVFERADFAEDKKEEYVPLLDPDRESFYIESETGPESKYK